MSSIKVPAPPTAMRMKQLAVFVERNVKDNTLITSDAVETAQGLVSMFIKAHWRSKEPMPPARELSVYQLFAAHCLLVCFGLLGGIPPNAEKFSDPAAWDGLHSMWMQVLAIYKTVLAAPRINSPAYRFARWTCFYALKHAPAAGAGAIKAG